MKFAELRFFRENGKTHIYWEGDPHLPLRIGEEYFIYTYLHKIALPLPWSFKIITEDRTVPPYAILVRTDIQPLWWIAVAVQYELEKVLQRLNYIVLEVFYKLGLLRLEHGAIPHWRQVNLGFWGHKDNDST